MNASRPSEDELIRIVGKERSQHSAEEITAAEKALAQAPHFTAALSNLSFLYSSEERWNDAVVLLERWLEIEPESYRPYDSLSLVEHRRGNSERAVTLVKKALELVYDPEQRERQPTAYRSRGEPPVT